MQLKTGLVVNEAQQPVVMVHGGAWNIPDEECEAHENGMEEALIYGNSTLKKGESALSTIVHVLSNMEASSIFDAGNGAVLNHEGEVELDAGIMCGSSKKWGAVAGVKHFLNPIKIANLIAEKGSGQFCFLANTFAEEFARAEGLSPIKNEDMVCEREKKRYERLLEDSQSYHTSHPFLSDDAAAPRGTIGCVVFDSEGRLAAGTSTGGTPFRRAGRIGDSPLPGCGYFANSYGAASATGWGEAIAAMSLCREAVGYLEVDTPPELAIRRALENMWKSIKNKEGEGATGGLILLDNKGAGAWGYTTPRMARGWMLSALNQRFKKVT